LSAPPIDLRSDTVTKPTEEMFQVMQEAALGDDNLRDDPTVHALEELSASLTGHEAALFCPTGTMANLLGTRMHTRPGDAVALPAELNMHRYGVIAWNSLQPLTIPTATGYPPAEEFARAIEWGLAGDTPPTLVIAEAPHNHAGGPITTPAYLAELRDVAHSYRLPFYLDGARIFNLAIAAGRPISEFTDKADLTMFCLSKGLSAPVGSVLCGPREVIERATRARFLMGGAMRQAGLLAACGIYALNHLVERLAEDHANARLLAAAIPRWPSIALGQTSVDTNMVYFDVAGAAMTSTEFCASLAERGVLAGAVDRHMVRFVTHRGIRADDIHRVVAAIDDILP
jgi:threonine aldolase